MGKFIIYLFLAMLVIGALVSGFMAIVTMLGAPGIIVVTVCLTVVMAINRYLGYLERKAM